MLVMSKSGNFGVVPVLHSVSIIIIIIIIIIQYLQPCKYCLKRIFFLCKICFFFQIYGERNSENEKL